MKEKTWITDIYIKGFQSHEDTHIKLKNGFNAIVGPSNSGKSAIIRDIKFVLFNELGDPNFITNGCNKYSSTIVFSNGKKVTREREGNENRYILEGPNMDPIELASFGRGPVEEVINFHGIRPISIAGSEEFISVQPQHDPAFFLKDTPAKKAALIGAIAKTDAVDIAIADIGLDVSRKKTEIKEKKRLLKEKKEFLEKFDNLPLQEKRLKEAEKVDAVIQEKKNLEVELLDSRDKLANNAEKIRGLLKILSKRDKIESLESKAEVLSLNASKESTLDSVIEKLLDDSVKFSKCLAVKRRISESAIKNAEKLIAESEIMESNCQKVKEIVNEFESNIKKVKHLKTIESKSESIKDMDALLSKLEENNNKRESIESVIENFETQIGRFKKGEAYIKDKKDEVDNGVNELTEEIKLHPTCPTCGADMTGREAEVIGN